MKQCDFSELDWQAFRYISEEMSAEESNQFELRLASDQEARESLARSVEIAQAVAVSSSSSSIETTPVFLQNANDLSGSGNRSSLMAVAVVAACLLLVVSIAFFSNSPDEKWTDNNTRDELSPAYSVNSDTNNRLIAFWADAEAAANEWLEEHPVESLETGGSDAFYLNADSTANGEDVLTIPPWMIAAVSSKVEANLENPDDGPLEN